MDMERSLRSFLYVPGDRPDRILKAMAAGADAVLIDLEDAVAPSAKGRAREHAAEALRTADSAVPIWVRISAGADGRLDLVALNPVISRVAGLVMAKCTSVEWVDEVAGSTSDSTVLSPLIESAVALRNLDGICAHPRVRQCQLGEVDLLADLAGSLPRGQPLLDHARVVLVYASAVADLLAPIGGVETDIRNVQALEGSSLQLAALGFGGRAAIHPSQIGPINIAFAASQAEKARARELVDLYDDALMRGTGALSSSDGALVDEAVVRRARQLLQESRD